MFPSVLDEKNAWCKFQADFRGIACGFVLSYQYQLTVGRTRGSHEYTSLSPKPVKTADGRMNSRVTRVYESRPEAGKDGRRKNELADHTRIRVSVLDGCRLMSKTFFSVSRSRRNAHLGALFPVNCSHRFRLRVMRACESRCKTEVRSEAVWISRITRACVSRLIVVTGKRKRVILAGHADMRIPAPRKPLLGPVPLPAKASRGNAHPGVQQILDFALANPAAGQVDHSRVACGGDELQ